MLAATDGTFGELKVLERSAQLSSASERRGRLLQHVGAGAEHALRQTQCLTHRQLTAR